MMAMADDFASAAEGLVGARFRMYGRDNITGLDCVGVIVAALAAIGHPVPRIAGYSLRNCNHTPFLRLFEKAGFQMQSGPPQIGDVVQVHPGPGQLHLLVACHNNHFVHAHAGLGRVVLAPSPLPWPIVQCWRMPAN